MASERATRQGASSNTAAGQDLARNQREQQERQGEVAAPEPASSQTVGPTKDAAVGSSGLDENSNSCWPFKSCSVVSKSRVFNLDDSNRRQENVEEHGNKLNNRSRKRPRSESLQVELTKIEMHQRLLVADQKKLLVELRDELQTNPHSSGQFEDENFTLDGRRAAVECKNLSYYVGLSSYQTRKPILHGVNLSVPEGAIYGLLGPSGCGKTTMLRCVAGRLTPESGSIKVFGFRPNESGSQIPGPAVGFMPQELSIYEEFTIRETLAYFGRINRMRADLLEARIEFLLSFLGLPKDRSRLIKHLSGGQKRRVSLAAALVHSPPLLILDEPTVGVDPLLRQVIWKYLVTLATSEQITIIITTHYIEEARRANIVGLMRQGRMLAEHTPSELLRLHNQTTLENVFLKLCLASDEQQEEASEGHQTGQLKTVITTAELSEPACAWRPMEKGEKYAAKSIDWRAWFSVLWALTWKNHLRLKRNVPVLVFQFILPAFQVLLFCWCIGGDPHDIPLVVVNEETNPQASKLFLDAINKSTFTQIPQTNLTRAIEMVERGRALAAVHISKDYTKQLQERLLHPADVTNETLANATIKLYPDLTNLHLALALESTFRDAFVTFARNTLNLLGYDSQLAELPIKVERAIFGSAKRGPGGYLEFMAPGVIVSITYVMATGLTALAFVLEKRDGLLERSQVSGVTTSQILLAHANLQLIVMTIQIALVLVVSFLVFRIPFRGPLSLVMLLVLLQGCAGMSYGLLISAVCNEENTAVMLLVGTFYINLILAGIIWPVEAMPNWLRLFSYAQPQTVPIESLRDILSRGYSLGDLSVQLGFIVTIGWLVVFLMGAGVCMRYIK